MNFSLSAILLSSLIASPAPAADGTNTNFRVNVNLVQLRVAVTDANGEYVRDLQAKDFRILENGVEQRIRTIAAPAHQESVPTSVFVLFDTSNHMYDGFPYAEDAIADFIRALPASNQVAVNAFSRNMTRLAGLTSNRDAAIDGLRHAVSGDDTALYDSLLLTLRDAAAVKGNRVIVVFSNGPDTASVLSPGEVRAVAEDEGIPIYVVSTRQHNLRSNAAFHDLTENTGGKTYFAVNWQKQELAFQAIAQDLMNSYVLGYYPEGNQDPGYRKIEVQISGDNGHKYRIRARTGYSPAAP
jgi:Ca-activated chloride channel family protein